MLSAFFIVVLVVVDLIGFGKYARFSLEICEARNQFCNDWICVMIVVAGDLAFLDGSI